MLYILEDVKEPTGIHQVSNRGKLSFIELFVPNTVALQYARMLVMQLVHTLGTLWAMDKQIQTPQTIR